MLNPETFKIIVNHTPLVSIDICILYEDKMLMCKRKNNPLKDEWFTPGGRIYKNETIDAALQRICNIELGLSGFNLKDFILLGAWDHMFGNSIFGKSISTHYINLPHLLKLSYKPDIKLDTQHDSFKWTTLEEISQDQIYHAYMQNYARLILDQIRC